LEGALKTQILGFAGLLLALGMFIAMIEVAAKNIGGAGIWVKPALTVMNCVIWGLYGVDRKDWFLITPNAVGIVVATITVVTAFVYQPQG
jgi:uncharacterized RDD family membrane protein YckC